MDSRLSGLELFTSISCENFRREKKKNKEKFILMDTRFSGLELFASIRCENFRREKKIKKSLF